MAGVAAAAAIITFWIGVQPLREKLVEQQAKLRQQERETGRRLALNDGLGQLMVDSHGGLLRLGRLPAVVSEAVARQQVKAPPTLAALIGPRDRVRGDHEVSFRVLGPIGTVVRTARPTFSWQPLAGANGYRITVDDASGKTVASGKVTGTQWRPARPLQRGQVNEWEVLALKGGEAVPSETPVARFRVLEPASAAGLERAERAYAGSPLVLGVLYAQAGLLDDAEREFRALLKVNPRSPLAQRLLDSVRSLRTAPPAGS